MCSVFAQIYKHFLCIVMYSNTVKSHVCECDALYRQSACIRMQWIVCAWLEYVKEKYMEKADLFVCHIFFREKMLTQSNDTCWKITWLKRRIIIVPKDYSCAPSFVFALRIVDKAGLVVWFDRFVWFWDGWMKK